MTHKQGTIAHRATISEIISLASRMAGLDEYAIRGRRRVRHITRARAAVCLIAREHGYSYPEIGKALRKDHTSVIHACRRVPIIEMYEPGYARFVRRLRRDARFPEIALAERPAPFLLGREIPTAIDNAIKPRNNFRAPAEERDEAHRFHRKIGIGSLKLAAAILEARG